MKPILFNTEMVRAILDGRKTVTRRAIKPRYRDDESGFQVIANAHTGEFVRVEKVDENECGIFADGTERYINPPYDVGDILYVRETYVKADDGYHYRADATPDSERLRRDYGYKYRPSIHMPREAARIFLRVTDVRVERLNCMIQADAIKEGLESPSETDFAILWDSTIKPEGIEQYGWQANPWVWVIEFERCEKP